MRLASTAAAPLMASTGRELFTFEEAFVSLLLAVHRHAPSGPRMSLPGPSRRITVEPIRVPATPPVAPDPYRPEAPEPEPMRDPVPSR